jgi:hypothetical protein
MHSEEQLCYKEKESGMRSPPPPPCNSGSTGLQYSHQTFVGGDVRHNIVLRGGVHHLDVRDRLQELREQLFTRKSVENNEALVSHGDGGRLLGDPEAILVLGLLYTANGLQARYSAGCVFDVVLCMKPHTHNIILVFVQY